MPVDFSIMSDMPLAHTAATKMLAAGLERVRNEHGLTQREVALQLGYKSSVSLSHMALGRVPIPIEKAIGLADKLQLDRDKFLIAVLEQRYPEINFAELLGVRLVSAGKIATRLELLAGHDLDDLSTETVSVLEDVVVAAHPRRRWLSYDDLALMELLRRKFSQLKDRSLGERELLQLEQCLARVLDDDLPIGETAR